MEHRTWKVEKIGYKKKKYIETKHYTIYKHSDDCYGIDYDINIWNDEEDVKIIDGKRYTHINRTCSTMQGKDLNNKYGKIEEIEFPEINFKIKFIDVDLSYRTGVQYVYKVSDNSYANLLFFLEESKLLPKYIKLGRGDSHRPDYTLIKRTSPSPFSSEASKIRETIENMELSIPLYSYGFNNKVYYTVCLKHILKTNFKGFDVFKKELFKYLSIPINATKEEIAVKIFESKINTVESKNRRYGC